MEHHTHQRTSPSNSSNQRQNPILQQQLIQLQTKLADTSASGSQQNATPQPPTTNNQRPSLEERNLRAQINNIEQELIELDDDIYHQTDHVNKMDLHNFSGDLLDDLAAAKARLAKLTTQRQRQREAAPEQPKPQGRTNWKSQAQEEWGWSRESHGAGPPWWKDDRP
jgi:hypothetical protein